MKRIYYPPQILILLLLCCTLQFASACGRATPTPEVIVVTATFTPEPATATPEPATDTPTPEPATETPTETPTLVPPSDTPTAQPATAAPTETPTVVSGPEGETIYFDPGESTATRAASFPTGGGEQLYALQASADQAMEVIVRSDSAQVNFTITSPDGTGWVSTPFGPGQPDTISTIRLPVDGTYTIRLSTSESAPATNYTASFEVRTPTHLGDSAEGIQFEAGSEEGARRGVLLPGGIKEYVLTATEGQTMTMRVASLAPINASINGPGGATWIAQPLASEVYIAEVTVVLPASGSYLVKLIKDLDIFPAFYDITFTIAGDAAPPAAEAESIQFEPGEDSAMRKSHSGFMIQADFVRW